ncbi:hypothetical protein NEF87_001858 [Candidatus Lokiarchaeum ossiferum]|uniref:Uncharacterized protein n=1 Tax=Candidatus Lokiarchaeum ossiferum TaxID=2951803 RepID=A0ABY6HQF5_9ARCH|nr:hypothetical protein NEF87_001858 [Candidatus Lokiarchaeum sp. B-35]
MPPLTNNKLKKILKRINANTNLSKKYKSQWKTLVNFLGNTFGIKIEAVIKVGTISKESNNEMCDYEIIFTPDPYKECQELYPLIITRFQEMNPDDNISSIENKLKLRYKNGTKIDLLSVPKDEFETEYSQYLNTRDISQINLNAVKLVKNAVESAGFGSKIRGSHVEAIAVNVASQELSICVETILNQLRKKKLATLKTFKHIRGLLE